MALPSRSRRTRRSGGPVARRTGRVVAWVLGVLVVLAVAAAGWIGVRGFLAAEHLESARSTASELAADIDDPVAAATAVESVADDAAAAHALTSDPVWNAAEALPWVGPQLAAIGTVAAAADEVAGRALQPLADVAADFSLDALRPTDGAIDTAPIAALHDAAQAGADGLRRAAASVAAIDADLLLPPLRGPVNDVRDLLASVGDGADALARTSALMPAMLGADGPRSYLVLFQNNAEWRSLGGIVGAMAVVGTDGGRMGLSAQGSSSDFDRYDDTVVPLAEDTLQVFGRRPALFVQNATQVPDFAVTAQIAREMWARETGTDVDGVLSLDPVALSYLLEASGPITLPTGDVLSADNATSLLLNEVYLRYERPADQDAFFQAAAAAVFATLSSGSVDPVSLVEALARAGDERRLLLWNARPEEQQILDGTTLQGALPTTDEHSSAFGVYLNDGTGSKMDYYMAAEASVGWCTPRGSGDSAELRVTLRNDAPADAAALPTYITGAENFGVAAGNVRTVTYVYLPEGAELVSAETTGSGNSAGFGGGTHGARSVLTWTTELAPSESATVTVRVDARRTAALDVEMTPTVNTAVIGELASACESAE